MMLPPNLPAWVATVAGIQTVGFFGKALLDAGGLDVPYALNAKNEQERRERIVQGSLIMAFAYGFSPIHSTLNAQLFRRGIKNVSEVDRNALFRLHYKDLDNPALFADALKKTLPHLNLDQKALSLLRKQIFHAKTSHLIVDLAMEGLLLTSVPFLSKLSTQFLTGDSHFVGERNLATKEDLNALYQKEDQEKKKRKQNDAFHTLATLALGAGLPVGVGFSIRHALSSKNPSPNFIQSFFKKVAPDFEYQYLEKLKWFKHIPVLPVAALVPVFLAFNLGRIMSTRSKREFKETVVQEPLFFASFFLVTPLIFRVLNKGAKSIAERLQTLVKAKASKEEINRVGRYSALTFIGAYLSTILVNIGVVNWTNQMTRKGIQDEVNALHATQQSHPPHPHK
ncbi:MAG: hypothetical protein ACK551_05990 [Vampirovibrionales bacterium]